MTDITTFVLPENTPEKAPMPCFDPRNATYFDMFAPNYYNLETVQALTQEGGGPLLLQVEQITVEYVYNPERGEESGEWKPVIYFVGDGPSLVVNQTRAKVLMNATGSIRVHECANVNWLEVSVGIENGQAQIVIRPSDGPVAQPVPVGSPNGQGDLSDINEVLFG